MRNKNIMFELTDISILLQYLYQSEDHEVRIRNPFAYLRYKMDEELNILWFNENFPELGWGYAQLSFQELLAIKRLLEENVEDIKFPEIFKNKWEEIKQITLTNRILNNSTKR